jgi:hypothetical protein
MPIIHLLQRIASLVPTHEAMLVVLLATTLTIALYARIRAPDGLKRHRLALGSMALGAVALLLVPHDVLPFPVIVGLFIAVAAGFVLHTVSEARAPDDDPGENVPRKGVLAVWAGVSFAVAVLFLVTDLGGYADALLAWEPESSLGLVEAHKDRVPVHAFAATRMLWDQGVVSSGHHSLLYGTGTYLLWQLVGVSTTTLRLMSVLLAIACLPITFCVGRATGSSRVAAAAMVVIAVNPVFLFYGRYGTSVAATFFGVLLMLWAFERLSDPTGQRIWIGFAAGAAAYVATLAYSPARVVTVAVVTTSMAVGTWNWRRLAPRRRQAFGLLAVTLAALWMVQETAGTADNFVTANSEQVFSFAPEQVEEFFGEEMDTSQLTKEQRRIMVGNVVKRAVSDYGRVLSDSFAPSPTAISVLFEDPPQLPLVQGPLLLFALWGFVRSFAYARRGWPLLLLASLAATTLPLFLTTRVDIHRLSIAIVPITLWAAIGIVAAGRVAHACGLSPATRHSFAVIFIVLAVSGNSTFLFSPDTTDRARLKENILTEIAESPYPVALALTGDFSLASEFQLNFLGRQTNDSVLPERIVRGLCADPEFDPYALALAQEKLHCATLILAPREFFQDIAGVLEKRGATVRSTGDLTTGLLRVDPVDEHSDPISERLERQPVILPLTDDLMEYFSDSEESRFRLGPDLEIDRDFESEEPRYDEAWNGEEMIMDGVAYYAGIGMQVDSQIEFAVPKGAVAFESVIGLNDGTQDCDDARVIFELRDDTGRRIFSSEPRAIGDPPQLIHVPLGSTATVELVVTDAGEHLPCGHGNWAEPVFVLSGC